MSKREVDIVDAHVTSNSNVVDVFSQYPLLDGDRQYTVEVTEFTCPLAGQGPLPAVERVGAEFILEVRRKLIGDFVLQNTTSLTMLPAPLGDPLRYAAAPHVYAPGTFTDDVTIFKKNNQRPMATPGDLAYHLQRYFNDIRAKYVANGPLAGADHGGGADVVIADDTPFCTVNIEPNGCLKLYFSAMFTKHFFIALTQYGSKLLGIGDQHNIIAFRTAAGVVIQGILALTNDPDGAVVIVAGEVGETVEYPALYTLERHFDHRVRLEIESQMNTPYSVAWTTAGKQKMSNIIATFPITTKTQTSVLCNSEGTPSGNVSYQTEMLVGDITWRKAEDKVSERYLLNDSKFFHNIRLEVFIVRKEWLEADASFIFAKEKLIFVDGESWTCKLRFRSV